MPQVIPIVIAAFQSAVTWVSVTAASATLAVTGSAVAASFVGNAILAAGGMLSASVAAGAPLAAATGALLKAAVISGLMKAISAKPKNLNGGAQIRFGPNPQAPRPFLFGRTGTAGTPVVATTHGTGKSNNKWLTYIVALSAFGPVSSIEALALNGVNAPTSGGMVVSGQYANKVWNTYRTGEWTQAWTPTFGPSTIPEWTSNHRGAGIAHACLTYEYDPNVFTGGAPAPVWTVSGSTSIYNASTLSVGYSGNPADIYYTILRGIQSPNGTRLGVGLAANDIDQAKIAAWRAVCNTNGWTCGGVWQVTAETPADVLRAVLQAGGAEFAINDGKASVDFFASAASAYTIRESDLAGDPIERPSTDRKARVSRIIPRFRSETDGWDLVPAAPVVDTTLDTQDGNRRRTETMDFPYVSSAQQARQLAAYNLRARRSPVFELPIKPHGVGIPSGARVTLDLGEYGISTTTGVVIKNDATATDGGTLTVRSDPSDLHTWALGQDGSTVSAGSMPRDSASVVQNVDAADWAATAVNITSGGSSLPIIRVSGTFPNPTLARLDIQVKPNGSTDWIDTTSLVSGTAFVEIRGLTPATIYNIRARYLTTGGVASPSWTNFANVTTGSFVSGSTAAVAPGAVRVGTDIFPGSGMTALPGTQLLNDQIGIDANGRLTNAGTGTAIVGNAQITIDANGRLTTTGTGTTVVDNSRIALTDGALATVNTRTTTLEAKTAPQNTNNYIGNSNFSGRGAAAGHSLDSWTIFGSTGSVYSNIYQTQSYAEITGATAARGIYQDIPVPNEFITGTDYWSMSALVRNIGSGAVRFYLQWLNEARDTSLGYSNTMQFSGSSWEYRKLDGITEGIIRPAAARWIRVHFDNNGATIASGNIQSLTNFTLTRTSYAMPWTASGEVPSIYAAVKTEESARASGDAALATRATTLEARSYVKGNQVKGSRPNYDSSNPNNLFSRFGYVSQGLWNVGYSAYVDGPYFSQSLTSASGYTWNAMVTNSFPVVVGATISAQAMLAKFGTWNAGTIRLVVYWYSDTAGMTVVSQAGNKSWESGLVVAGQNTTLARWVDLPNLVVPSGIQSCRIGIWTDNVTGNGVYTEAGAWMLKAEYGSTCTAWSDDALPLEIDARVRTEESARASGDSANASLITTLTAKTNGNPNLFPSPTPVNLRTPTQQGWYSTPVGNLNAPWVGGLVYFKARAGGAAVTEYYVHNIDVDTVLGVGDQYTISAVGYAGTGLAGDNLQMRLEVMDPTYTTILHASPWVTLNDKTQRGSSTTNYSGSFLNPVKLRVSFKREWAASGSYQDVVFNAVKVEQGTVATVFTNTAQVIVQADAISTINDSAAFYQILVAASGGDPALIRLFSGLGGSEVAIAAKIISLINTSSGVAMPVMRATGGEAFFQRPISSDFGSRRVTLGPGYGVSGSEVVLWFGPSSIAPASQSRTNCIFALGTDGIVYYGGTSLEVGGMQGTLNLYDVNLTRTGSGNTSQSMTATGYAPGTITYSWTLQSGDAVNIGSPSSATTTVGHTLSLGETKTSVVKCTMTSSAGPSTFRLLNISSSELS